MKIQILKSFIGLVLLAPALFAQELSLRAIEAAVEDDLYEFAEQQIWQALSIERPLEEQTDLTLLLIRSLIGQKRYDDATILSDESGHLLKADSFTFWKARAYRESGNDVAALQTLQKLPPKSEFAPNALRMTGRIEQARGNSKAAEEAYTLFHKKFSSHAEAQQNLVDLATVQLDQELKNEAEETMQEILKQNPQSELADSIRLLLARELLAKKDEKSNGWGAELLRQLGETESALPRLRIAAWLDLSNLERNQGNLSLAAETLLKAETLTDENALKTRQKAARANLLFDEAKNDEALPLFDEAIRIAPNEELAAEIMVQKADVLLALQKYTTAEDAFQAGLDVTSNPRLRAQALSGKGWSLWHQDRYEESAIAFEQAALKHSDPEEGIVARVKAGDARLAITQFEMALKNYTFVTETAPDHPLAARALHQSGIALLEAKKFDQANHCFQLTETRYPESEFAPSAALHQAALLQQGKKYEAALSEYVRIANQYTNAVIQATALHQQGLILFDFTRYPEALALFDSVIGTYPDSAETPQAFYMRGFCHYLQGNVEYALILFNEFIETYPESIWTPDTLFLVAEQAYNCGNYPQAKLKFLNIVTRYPKHNLADKALYWSGNALLKQDLFLDAFNTYTLLAKDYPHSELIPKARFAQGETLTELGEFARAILAYEEVIQAAPDEPIADQARGRIADCLFTLGSTDKERYQKAMETYQLLYKRPATHPDLKLQALYKIARCEDKLGQPAKAFAHYVETVYSVGEQSEPLSPQAILWFTRAALEAATHLETQQNWAEAVRMYERIVQANVPAKTDAQKRIEEIKKDRQLE